MYVKYCVNIHNYFKCVIHIELGGNVIVYALHKRRKINIYIADFCEGSSSSKYCPCNNCCRLDNIITTLSLQNNSATHLII